MTISIAIERAKRQTATIANRRRQFLNELRMDEQSMIAEALDSVDEYRRHDREADVLFIRSIKAHYRSLTDEAQMASCERVYMVWRTAEDRDEQIISALDDKLDQTRVVMRSNNDHLLNGAWTPAASGGAA